MRNQAGRGGPSRAAFVVFSVQVLVALGLPLALSVFAPISAAPWAGVLLLGLIGFALIQGSWTWLVPPVGAVAMVPVLLELGPWRLAYLCAAAMLAALAGMWILMRTWQGMSAQTSISVDGSLITLQPQAAASATPGETMVVEVSRDGGATWLTVGRYAVSEQAVLLSGIDDLAGALVRVVPQSSGERTDGISLPQGSQGSVVAQSGDRQVTVSWSPPSNTGGTPIIDYIVQVSRADAFGAFASGVSTADPWVTVARTPSPLPTMVVTGLTNGVPVVFRVAAVNAAGIGPYTQSSAPVVPLGVSDPPAQIVAERGDGRLIVRWTAPANDGGLPIVDYRVQSSTDGGITWLPIVRAPSAHCETPVVGLVNGTAYRFRVAAVNAAGQGNFSEASNLCVPAGLPGEPGAISGVVGDGTVSLAWTAPQHDGGDPVQDYRLEVSADLGQTWLQVPRMAHASPTAQVSGLTSGVSYVFRVAAVNGVGMGSFSAVSTAFTPIGAPGAIHAVMAELAPTKLQVAPPVVAAASAGSGARGSGTALRWMMSVLLILAGVALIGVAVRTTVFADMQFELGQVQVDEASPTPSAPPDDAPLIGGGDESGAGLPTPSIAPPQIEAGTVLGTIRFERNGKPLVSDEPLVVRQGIGRKVLSEGPGHYPTTVLPGQPGNAGIAGHRTGWSAPFFHLDELQTGDLIVYTADDGATYRYVVHSTQVVDPQDTWVLADDPLRLATAMLTLTTCDPPGTNERRLVVFAYLVA
jgi:LPXTG-site transpeptidase (sortase) family protein